MYINFDYYKVFYYVAKYGSITRAAEALMNNQPNITRTVKNLETELNCTLFIRSRKGVSLTPEGERLFAHISAAVEQIQAGEEEICLERTLNQGLVTIGTSEIALRCFLLPVLNEYRQKYPGVRLRLFNHSTPQALSAVIDGLADIAVVTTPTGKMHSLISTDIMNIQECAICGTAFSELAERSVSISDLSEIPIVSLGRQTKTYELYSEWFEHNGCVFSPDIEAATADQILPMVKNNLGVGFVPEEFLNEYSDEQKIFRLSIIQPVPQRRVCFVKRSKHTLSIAAREMERMILSRTIGKS